MLGISVLPMALLLALLAVTDDLRHNKGQGLPPVTMNLTPETAL
jgi:hypothetical protein